MIEAGDEDPEGDEDGAEDAEGGEQLIEDTAKDIEL